MDVFYLIGGFVVGGLLGYFLGILSARTGQNRMKSELEQKNTALQTRFDELKEENQRQYQKLEKETGSRREAEIQVATLQAEIRNLNEKIQTEQKHLDELQKKFRLEFENVATKILKQNTQEFSQSSVKNMSDILNPLKEKISSFEKKVEDTYQKGLKDQTNLLAVLKNLHELSMRLDKDAQNLTKALKSDSKKQGNWGEVVLERMLEDSGLIKDQEYFIQETGQNEEGQTIRPDVLIRLPQDKHLIIDSKVSLTAYHDFISSEEEQTREKALKRHMDSMKGHVKELSDKNYPSMANKNVPDFVLMFMPLESAFALAVQTDPSLFNYAWDKKIVIVSPTTLLATLKTIEAIWRQEKQTRNALEIAEQGGKLYDKFVGFMADLEKIGTNLDRASASYQEAHKKLGSGRDNLLRQVEKMKTLGAKTSKSLSDTYPNLET